MVYVHVQGGTLAGRKRPPVRREWRCACGIQQFGYSAPCCGRRRPKEH